MAIKFMCYDRDGNENPEIQEAVEQTQARLDELSRSWQQAGVVPSTALDLDRLEDAIAEARHKGLGIEWTTVGSMSSFFDSLSEQERQDTDRLYCLVEAQRDAEALMTEIVKENARTSPSSDVAVEEGAAMPYKEKGPRIGSIALQKAVEQTQARLDELSRNWEQSQKDEAALTEVLARWNTDPTPILPANYYDSRTSDYTPDWLAEAGRLQEENRSLRYILASLIEHAGGEIHVPDEYLVSPSRDASIATERDVERCVTIYRLRQ